MTTPPLVISLDEMMTRIKAQSFHSYDRVVAIGRGGILPGYLVARYLDCPFETISLVFRDDRHQPIYSEPQVIQSSSFETRGKTILLVDDVANTGATLETAKSLLVGAIVETLVISGTADYSLFGPHTSCIIWPWQTY